MPRNSWTGFGDTLNTTLVYAQPSAFNGEVYHYDSIKYWKKDPNATDP
tara:strand:+ start:20339 stop:20482 length:144 start_codon:yes stop_codon:yes gene_type:complete